MATAKEVLVDRFMEALDNHVREVVLSMTRESDYDCPSRTREHVREALLELLATEPGGE